MAVRVVTNAPDDQGWHGVECPRSLNVESDYTVSRCKSVSMFSGFHRSFPRPKRKITKMLCRLYGLCCIFSAISSGLFVSLAINYMALVASKLLTRSSERCLGSAVFSFAAAQTVQLDEFRCL